jgi:histone H1/5
VGLINREPKVINLAARAKKKPKTKTRIKRAARHATSHECPACHKRYTNPLTHVCTVKTDYKKRVAAEKRRQATEARRKAAAEKRRRARERKAATRARQREAARVRRKAAADRRKAAAAARRKGPARTRSRPAQPKHDFRTCRDGECERYACVAYKEGYEDGYPDGMLACPREHTG